MNIWSLIGTPWTVIKSGQKGSRSIILSLQACDESILNSLTRTEEFRCRSGRKKMMMILLYKVE